jgi:hypothetical protein
VQHSVAVGENLHGSIALRKNPEDIHDIEIKMSMHFESFGREVIGHYIFT